jgi:5'-3' exoribonuclease 1
VNNFSARDQRFVQELIDDLHLNATWDEVDEYGQHVLTLKFNVEGSDSPAETEYEPSEDWQSDDEADESDVAIQRVFAKYDKAKVVDNTVEDFENSYEETLKENFNKWKTEYYKVGASIAARLIVGQTRNQLRRPCGPGQADVPIRRGSPVDLEVLLHWCEELGLVLRLPLRPAYLR